MQCGDHIQNHQKGIHTYNYFLLSYSFSKNKPLGLFCYLDWTDI
jgi:hypothetical protein